MRLATLGKAARTYSVSETTLRSWCDLGLINSCRTGSYGWRRVDLDSLETYLGLQKLDKINQKEESKSIGLYCRVSSIGQKESLNTQITDCLSILNNHHSIKSDSVRIYKDICSGVNVSSKSRLELYKLWNDTKNGHIKMVYIKDKSRLSRLPGIEDMFQQHCSDHNCTIDFLLSEDHSSNDDLREDIDVLVDYLTHITNKRSGMKAKYKLEKHLSEDAEEKAKEMIEEGYSLKEIHQYLKENGYHAEFRSGEKTRISYTAIIKFSKSLNGSIQRPKSQRKLKQEQISAFLNLFYEKDKAGYVISKTVLDKYKQWVIENRLNDMGHTNFGVLIKSIWNTSIGRKIIDGKNTYIYKGMKEKDYRPNKPR